MTFVYDETFPPNGGQRGIWGFEVTRAIRDPNPLEVRTFTCLCHAFSSPTSELVRKSYTVLEAIQ